jgi:tetratricopeptide (TPR) repeat protein
MKNNFPYCLTNFLFLLLVSITFSCDFIYNSDSSIDTLLLKAEKNIKNYPENSLLITKKILRDSIIKDIDDEKILKAYEIRQKSFAVLENMDSVLIVGKQIRFVASKISDSLAIANSLLPVRGEIDFSSQQEMIAYFPGAIATFKNNHMPFESARLSASYGTILCHKGDFVKAQTFLLDSYKVFNTLDSIKPIINVCMNIGSTYAYTKSNNKSLEYYKKAYEVALKVKDSNAISSVLMNIGTFYADDIKDQDKALDYYQRALPYVPKKSGAYLKMKIDYNIAVASFAKGDLLFSERTFQNMLSDCIKNNAYEGVAMASKGLGDLYIKKQQPDKALLYLTRAIHLADSLDMSYEALQMKPSLLVLYKINKNFEAALLVSEQMKTSNDSILSAEKQNAVHELEIKYQTEKKVTEISHLKALSKWRQLIVYGLSFFVIVLFFILRKQMRLYKEKQYSYALLMQQYKAELLERLAEQSEKINLNLNSKVNIPTEELDLFSRLMSYYEKEKPYLNPKYKAVELAKTLEVSQREIAALLKTNGFNGFTNFNNKFRIEEVKRQFEDPKNATLKMEAIANNSGFGSRQSFYTAFEEFTGLNPGFYRAEILK